MMKRRLTVVLLAGAFGCGGGAESSSSGVGTTSSSETSTTSGMSSSSTAATPSTSSSTGAPDGGSSSTGSEQGIDFEPAPSVIRVHVAWAEGSGYTLGAVKRESSGTEALLRRAQQGDSLGSFIGIVSDPISGEELLQQTIGIGVSYRELTRSITFRFPAFNQPATFTLLAPDPQTGESVEVLSETIDPQTLPSVEPQAVSVTELRAARRDSALRVNIYAEGYLEGSESRFLESAQAVVDVLESNAFPGVDHLEFHAVFAPSAQPLGVATDLGEPIPVWDSFLTLYHPYWSSFSRWFHVMYPTDEERFRDALAQAPYDYPFIVTDSAEYWGTGNYNAYTVVPSDVDAFDYLVLHELGHYFGLNEEYSTQDTELLFAPAVQEPWSQNMTFQQEAEAIKWHAHIDDGTPIPTSSAQWPRAGIGAYFGGYAGEDSRSLIPVPDGVCTMSSGLEFCDVCRSAMADKLEADLAP